MTTPTVLVARNPSAMRPWTPQYDGLQRDKVTHAGTEQNGPPAREFAASGPFSQVVAGVGSGLRTKSFPLFRWCFGETGGMRAAGIPVPAVGAAGLADAGF